MIGFTVSPLSGNLVIVLTVSSITPTIQVVSWLMHDARERRDYFGRWPLGIPGPVWGLLGAIDLVLAYFVGVFVGKRVADLTLWGPLKALIAILAVLFAVAVLEATAIFYLLMARRRQGVIPLAEVRMVEERVGASAPGSGDTIVMARETGAEMPATALGAVVEPLLRVSDLEVFYGAARALRGISFDVYAGEVVSIIGGNGAGKSTTLKTVSGVSEILKTVVGGITFRGEHIESLAAHEVARLGIVHVPEGRRVFPESTVEDNLILGSYRRYKTAKSSLADELDAVYQRFPVLKDRRSRPAGFLSGGEQQMLAIGRGLMARPALLLLDEPSLGLAPILIEQMFGIVRDLAAEGTTILLVEQMANQALEIADRGYVLETGSITLAGTGRDLLSNAAVRQAYLGA